MSPVPQDHAADEASLFLALPWPTAAIGPDGLILAGNPAFSTVFPAVRPGESSIDICLGPSEAGVPASRSLPHPATPAETWQGNWPAITGDQGHYRLLINCDTNNPDVRWVFLPENPVIHARARVTPRTELELTRMLLDHTPDYIFLRDIQGGFIFASRALTSLLGMPGDGYEAGKPIAAFLSPECQREYERFDKETLATKGATGRPRFQFVSAAGVRRLFDIKQEQVLNKAGNPLGIITFARDITATVDRENKLYIALEQARTAGQAKGFFVANVSHEIRTPINGILGMAELCLDTSMTAEQRKYVQAVLDCGRTLLTLVNDILDFSKIEAGRLTFENIEFDIARLIADTVAQFAPTSHARGVELVLDLDPALPRRFLGDPTRIRQILNNLVSNACKFTEHGHVVVAVRQVARQEGRMRLNIDIADTGIGIPADKLSTIFEAFTQADATTTRRFGGTGLGLAIVKRLAEMMNGNLTVNSRPGVGSVFTVELELPIAKDRDPATAQPLLGRTVGILSADPIQRETLCRTMRGLGARVEESAGGVDAFRLVLPAGTASSPTHCELIIADYPVAPATNNDMVDLIIGRSASAAIPVITLAGIRNEPPVLSRLRNSPHRHLEKPATVADLRGISLGLLGLIDPEASDPVAETVAPRRILRILLAEDNPVNQELALRRLEKLGHQVDLANDGGKAWEQLISKRYDVALLDVQMPVLDGIRLAKRIREMEAGSPPRLPLVALTALAMESDKRECLDAGFDAFLSKPFLLEDLRKLLDELAPELPAAGSPRRSGAESRGNTPVRARPQSVQPPVGLRASPVKITRPPFPHLRPSFDFESILRACSKAEADDLLAAGEVFLNYWEKESAALIHARERNNLPELAMIVHRIKGGVGSLRAKNAHDIAIALESATKLSIREEIDIQLRRLVDELQSVADGIRNTLDAHRHSHP